MFFQKTSDSKKTDVFGNPSETENWMFRKIGCFGKRSNVMFLNSVDIKWSGVGVGLGSDCPWVPPHDWQNCCPGEYKSMRIFRKHGHAIRCTWEESVSQPVWLNRKSAVASNHMHEFKIKARKFDTLATSPAV